MAKKVKVVSDLIEDYNHVNPDIAFKAYKVPADLTNLAKAIIPNLFEFKNLQMKVPTFNYDKESLNIELRGLVDNVDKIILRLVISSNSTLKPHKIMISNDGGNSWKDIQFSTIPAPEEDKKKKDEESDEPGDKA